jgi:predicted esterase
VWSGKLLKKAIQQLEKCYNLQPQKVYFYGYSAGGQCSALFYQWMPDKVAGCGIHASGVYPEKIKVSQVPFLITCGTEDKERFQISRHFIYHYREHGGLLLWKYFPNLGHELSKEALELAKVWFDDLLSSKEVIAYGEDDTKQIKQQIDTEFRNPLYSEKMRELWQK